MYKTRLLTLTLVGLAFVYAAPAMAAWEARTATHLFLADRNNQPHPEELVQTIVLSKDTDGAVFVCVAYGNNAAAKNSGRVLVDVEITRGSAEEEGDGDGEAGVVAVETLEFEGRISNRKYQECKAVGALKVGDSVMFMYRLRNFKRIELNRPSGTGGFAVISTISESKPKNPFLPPNPEGEPEDDNTGGGGGGNDDGGSGGGGNDDGGSGGGGTSGPMSAADQNAAFNIYRQVSGSTGAQVVVTSMGWRLDYRKGGVVSNFPSSGYASSLAGAGQSLCRAIKCASGGISTTLQNNILRLAKAARSGGRWIIALRLESGNRWYVDFIKGKSPYHGTQHGSDTSAVNAFCNSAVVGSAC